MAFSSMGLKLGVSGFFADQSCRNKYKTNMYKIPAVQHYNMFIFTPRQGRCRWHMHLMSHGYFDCGKKQRIRLEPHARIKRADSAEVWEATDKNKRGKTAWNWVKMPKIGWKYRKKLKVWQVWKTSNSERKFHTPGSGISIVQTYIR